MQVRGGYVLHIGAIEGSLKVGDKVVCTIDGVSSFNDMVRVVSCLCRDLYLVILGTGSLCVFVLSRIVAVTL